MNQPESLQQTGARIAQLVASLPTQEQRDKFAEALLHGMGRTILEHMNTDNVRAN